MADKLDVILLKPRCWLDWWAGAGAGTELLTQRYPKAQAVLVEPLPELLAAMPSPRGGVPWVCCRAPRGGPGLESGELPAGQAQLLWANMMLHASSEPDALLRRWHRLLAVDGFLMFACLGPDTLRQLRGPCTPAWVGPRRPCPFATCTISATHSCRPASPTR